MPLHNLTRFPRLEFIGAPTPLEYLPRFSDYLGRDIFIKRDDVTPMAMGGNKLAGGALKSVSEIIDDPQIRAAEMIVDGQDPVLGSLYRVGTPMKLGGTPLDVTAMPAPGLGEHTDEILSALGLSGTEVDGLKAVGIVRAHTSTVQ